MKIKTLEIAWEKRMKLLIKAVKMRAEIDKLREEVSLLVAKRDKAIMEGEGLWRVAIIETKGNIKFKWENWSSEKKSCECHLETGEIFKP